MNRHGRQRRQPSRAVFGGVLPLATFHVVLLTTALSHLGAAELLLEAEAFEELGGWKLDTQCIASMGSPYLLAHGLGVPVADARTTARFPRTGRYRVFVRTKDWVAPWGAEGQPGKFQLVVAGRRVPETFGTRGAEWSWHPGGWVDIPEPSVTVALHDLTGFDGRCDAVFFTTDANGAPPNDPRELRAWRREVLGFAEQPEDAGEFHLVVVGGGYSGMGAAISAARMGLRVALIQNRGVLGGNGSSEVRVWANGLVRRGRFPRIGEIVEEFSDDASMSPGTYEEFEDAKKERVIRAEEKIRLFLHHHADEVEMDGNRVVSVVAFDTRTGFRRRFSAPLFVDATGHGTVGFLAGAEFAMSPEGRMGMSNMWRWENCESPLEFPETPWALQLTMDDFPYPKRFHGQWFWESGFDKDPIKDAELIRDWNLRAVFGAFNAMKNGGGAAEHRNARLTWVAYIGGPRESRRLVGDVLLTREDIVEKRDFPDGCVPSTWSIDLHYPKKQYMKKYADNPFISIAEFDHSVDRTYGYPVPYRCFYSRNISNLFMAGRCVSVTHEALGTVRVMKTCGMMGEVVGKAASICVVRDCTPRDVYEEHLEELKELLRLPGKARRDAPGASLSMPVNIPAASPRGPVTGLDPFELPGLIVDDTEAEKKGSWTEGTGLKGYVSYGYLYAPGGSASTVRFRFEVEQSGLHEVRLAVRPHPNRARNVPVQVQSSSGVSSTKVDMRADPPLPHGFVSLGVFEFRSGEPAAVVISAKEAEGYVHADAVQILPVKPR